jgi:uncharacterized ferritin-like protein (DUF455 family)
VNAPPAGTVEAWAWEYLHTTSLAAKLAPGAPPAVWETDAPARRVDAPVRPAELVVEAKRGLGRISSGALKDPRRRAELFHTFLHHELQAAELMAWAVLAFPQTPQSFRKGLLGILSDEVRHMGFYAAHLATLGFRFGDFPVRDWFWERVPHVPSAAAFVATLGMGFEGGNLDHAARFAQRLRAAGDAVGAELQARVGAEEEPHAAFALHWFERFTGGVDFDAWAQMLPPPLSPMLMRGMPLELEARRRAGFPAAFLERLARV